MLECKASSLGWVSLLAVVGMGSEAAEALRGLPATQISQQQLNVFLFYDLFVGLFMPLFGQDSEVYDGK